ncbi:MAG TPA: zinc-binding alcohol dehydrogenase family protein [Acidobacteriaceae bacterium]|nr:zinc-binding alcohol dehydrogenase family protein [Acidobacteriaceae bacterium]
MKAAVVHSFSAPPRFSEFADPEAGEGEVLVRVTAAGLHPIVRGLASGSHYGSTGQLPFAAGVDGVGRLEDGTRIFFGGARSPFGTMAERALAAEGRYLKIPDALDDVTVAAMMNPGMSSWAALEGRAQFVSGESVLILGATGSAGQMAVQIAKRMGARRIVAAGRSEAALEAARALGADATISLKLEREALVAALREEIYGNGIDVVLDYVWGSVAEAALAAIAQKGLDHASRRIRYVEIGSMAGPTIALPGATLRSSGLELVGSGFGSVSMEKLFAALAEFLQAAAQHPFAIETTAAPLSEVERLWNAPEKGRLVFQP